MGRRRERWNKGNGEGREGNKRVKKLGEVKKEEGEIGGNNYRT